jgi:MATE family multidrug resistance protein
LLHIGSNLILRTFFVQLPFFFGTWLAAGLGDVPLALHGVLMQLFFVMTYGIDGFSHTAETLAGYAYGARDRQQLRQSSYYSAVWGIALALVIGAVYFLFGPTFVAWMSTSPEVQAAAAEILPWLFIAPLLCVGAFLFDGIFIGTTHIVEMRNCMIVAVVIWLATLAVTFESLGYHSVWLSMSVFMAARTLLMWLYYPRVERHATA